MRTRVKLFSRKERKERKDLSCEYTEYRERVRPCRRCKGFSKVGCCEREKEILNSALTFKAA